MKKHARLEAVAVEFSEPKTSNMKSVLQVAIIAIAIVVLSSFSNIRFAPKLYPEIEQFFKSASSTGVSSENQQGLVMLKDNLAFSKMDSRDYNVIFTSSNPLTSAAARVFLHTLISARKLKRVNVFACSPEPSATPELVAALKKFGYRVEASQGPDEIEIRFADNAEPIILGTVDCSDKKIPTEDRAVITLCQDCNMSELTSSAFNLSYKTANLDNQLTQIATDLVYTVSKK